MPTKTSTKTRKTAPKTELKEKSIKPKTKASKTTQSKSTKATQKKTVKKTKTASSKRASGSTNSDLNKIKKLLKGKNALEKVSQTGLVFEDVNFDKEAIELIIKANDDSPFVFYQFPFSEIKNWRELIKQNPNLSLQNRMLEEMDSVNYFSKNNLAEFKERNDGLLRNKDFYNNFIENAKNEVVNRVQTIKESRNLEKVTESLNFIEQTFKKYRYLNSFLSNAKGTAINKQLTKTFMEIEAKINSDFDNFLLKPENLRELISFISSKFDDMMIK